MQNQQAQNADGSLIPQISINPWDPSQGVQMTLASPALAMQLLQANQRQQWLAAQQAQQAEAAPEEEEEEDPSKVKCIPPGMVFISGRAQPIFQPILWKWPLIGETLIFSVLPATP